MSWILEYFVVHLLCVYIYVRQVMSSYLMFCCIYFDAWCITCCRKRGETPDVYTEWYCTSVISTLMLSVSSAVEVLVLGLLVVVYKIPNSSCILFNTAVVVARVVFTHGFSRCRGYWIWLFCRLFVVRVYICMYVRLIMPSYLFFCI